MKKFWSLLLVLFLTGLSYADITPLPDPPSRTAPSTFATKADAFLGALPAFATEANQLATDVNGDALAAAASAASALGYSNIALSSANFAGDWDDQAGAAAPPYAVWHAGNYWQLVSAVLDVSATEPGQTADWRVIGDKITVSTIADLRLISGVGVSSAYILGHSSANDGGQGVFYWDADSVLSDNGGTIFAVAGVPIGRWIRQLNGVIDPAMFGAIRGEYSAANAEINSTAIQAMFNYLHTETAPDFVNARNARNYSMKVEGAGKYYVSSPITFGGVGAYPFMINLDMTNWSLCGYGLSTNYVLTITNPRSCKLTINCDSEGGNGVYIDSPLNCDFPAITSGADTGDCLYTGGFFMNCTLGAVRLGQNGYRNGATYGWRADYTFVTQAAYAGMPIVDISLIGFSGVSNGIHWKSSSALNGGVGAVRIGVVECEGTADIAIHLEGLEENVTIDSIWSESGSTSNWMELIGCASVAINGMKAPGYSDDRPMLIQDCGHVHFGSITGTDTIKYGGTTKCLSVNFIQGIGSAPRELFQAVDGASEIETIKIGKISFKNSSNVEIYKNTGIDTGQLRLSDNVVSHPRGITDGTNVIGYYCSGVQDAAYTDISPLGYRETKVTITEANANKRMLFKLSTAKLVQDRGKYVAIACWKPTALSGSNITSSGISALMVYTDKYGDIFLQKDGWLFSFTEVALLSTTLKVSLWWNHGPVPAIGDSWLFGGLLIVPGTTLMLP